IRFALLAVLTWLGLVGASLAQTDAEACAAIEDDGARLACYDSLFRTDDMPGPDAIPLSVIIPSDQTSSAYPTGRAHAEIAIACAADDLSVRFSFAGHVLNTTGSNTPIRLQRDLQADRVYSLPPGPNGETLLIEDDAAAQQFLQSLR